MQGETKERWKILCEQAATEQDPVLVREGEITPRNYSPRIDERRWKRP
jgi:hypothetical protein